jgi:hypothetical protein
MIKSLDVPYPVPSVPSPEGTGYRKGYVPGYSGKRTLLRP